jgi:hypothetical protein
MVCTVYARLSVCPVAQHPKSLLVSDARGLRTERRGEGGCLTKVWPDRVNTNPQIGRRRCRPICSVVSKTYLTGGP